MNHRFLLACALLVSLAAALASSALAAPGGDQGRLPEQLRAALSAAMNERVEKIAEAKNEHGKSIKRGRFLTGFRKVDEEKYQTTLLVDTAGDYQMTVERFRVTLEPDPNNRKKWLVTDEVKEEAYDNIFRTQGRVCSPFEKFSFDRYGMQMSSGPGVVCLGYERDEIVGFEVGSDQLTYKYTAPEYQNYLALQRITKTRLNWSSYLEFEPKMFDFQCDPATCEEILAESFTGLQRASSEADVETFAVSANVPAGMKELIDKESSEVEKERRENPFAHFDTPVREGNRQLWASARKNDKAGVAIYYDNWGGYEVYFLVEFNHPAYGHQTFPLYGYYSDETLANTTPYELELRDDPGGRFHEVFKVQGTIDAGLRDPEVLEAEIEYGITVKQEIRELPYFIAGIPKTSATGGDRPPGLSVRSIQMDGEDLTFVTGVGLPADLTKVWGNNFGIVVFPEPVEAGTKINLKMAFSTAAIRKVNPAFSQMARFGWMPFLDFGDFVDEFELEIRVPSQYTVLGVGHEVSNQVSDGVRTTLWRADNPVAFPTIIFGKYFSDDAGKYKATKLNGTEIPVTVHVDTVSMGQIDIDVETGAEAEAAIEDFRSGARGIRPNQLRPIATQAAVAINLYKEISGLDYPYGELNLVNDPAWAGYGQAPSALIYLGAPVFRGEGTMAGDTFLGGGGTGTAKFLKSVTAHEVGHQWWGSRVSNANDRAYWFVESLAEYFSAIYLERAHGDRDYIEQVDEWRRAILAMDQMASIPNSQVLFPGENGGGSRYAALYAKGPYAFHLLRQIFGDEKFFAFFKEFTQRLAEKGEIVTRDIQMVAEDALGGVDPETGEKYRVDLSWFFDQWIRGVGVPEYRFTYDVRDSEDGGSIIEGTIYQRVIVGNERDKHVLEGEYFRTIVPVTAMFKGNKEATFRALVEGPETPIRFKVDRRPLDVVVNKYNQTLSHDPVVNKSW